MSESVLLFTAPFGIVMSVQVLQADNNMCMIEKNNT